jgi:hypothetical protein
VRSLAPNAISSFFELIFQGRVHDIGLLDALVRLAARDEVPNRRALREILSVADASTSIWHGVVGNSTASAAAAAAAAAADGDVEDNEDDAALTLDASRGDFAIDNGVDQSIVDDVNDPDALGLRLALTRAADLGESFERFAALRSVLRRVLTAWNRLSQEVKQYWVVRPSLAAQLLPDAQLRFGPFSETLQVKAAVALDALGARGVLVDVQALLRMQVQSVDQYAGLLDRLLAEPTYAAVFGTDLALLRSQLADSTMERRARLALCVKPRMRIAELRTLLLRVVDEIRAEHNVEVTLPQTSNGELAVTLTAWQVHASRHRFVELWLALFRCAKQLTWLAQLETHVDARTGSVHPQWTPLKRNGRSGCGAPNLQATPRAPGCRELFCARPGHVFLCIDYSYIELCTLAAVCERRYGRSALADTIRRGVDPHSYTAAAFEHMSVEQFEAARRADPRLDAVRHKAKAINFGIPGGEGADTLRDYVAAGYGITMTAEEAAAYRERVVTEIYPELELYLADDALALLADGLGCSVNDVWRQFHLERKVDVHKFTRTLLGIRHVIQGRSFRTDGYPFKRSFVARVWQGLAELNRREHLRPLIARYEGGDELYAHLFGAHVTTLTGRVRGGVSYTRARNTPFSGLAADGAKLALWDLVHSDYRVVAFVHDELLVELPLERAPASPYANTLLHARTIERILIDAMQTVCPGIPIRCEFALSHRWSKKSRATFNSEGELIPCDDEEQQLK